MSRRYLFFLSQDYSFAVLRPLQEAILQRGDEVRWFLYGDEIDYTMLESDEKRLNSVDEILQYNPEAVFIPGNVAPSFIPGLKVKVFHGLPSDKQTKSGTIYHYIIRGVFDLYCTQGPDSTTMLKKLAIKHKTFHAHETGWPKLDPLFKMKQNKNREKPTIFFASTFSPKYTKARVLYPWVKKMIEKYDYRWYITLHPKMSKDVVDDYRSLESDRVKFLKPTQIYDGFIDSDLMLCDTSSIVFEYLVQLKPVITFQYNNPRSVLINVEKLEDLEDTINNTLKNNPKKPEEIKECVNQYHPYYDGKSSHRVLQIVDEMLEGKYKPQKKKPLNIIRNLKLRKELNYWKFF